MKIKRLKKRKEKRKHFIEEIKQNELISKKRKKICKTLNYTEHLCFNFCFYFISWYSSR